MAALRKFVWGANKYGKKKYLDVENCDHETSYEGRTLDFCMYIGANNELYLAQLFYMKNIKRKWLSEGAMPSCMTKFKIRRRKRSNFLTKRLCHGVI
jgi:hypothetical protein